MALSVSCPGSWLAHPRAAADRSNGRGPASLEGARGDAVCVLERYANWSGCGREVISRPGAEGTTLVVDRDASTLSDERLVAHLAADEPHRNAALVCSSFVRQASIQAIVCRPLSAEDFRDAPPVDDAADPELNGGSRCDLVPCDRGGRSYRLMAQPGAMSIPELRWRRVPAPGAASHAETVSVREVIACLESYEPVRGLTRFALAARRDDGSISTAVLRMELGRVLRSPIILNRKLREAVLAISAERDLSMSEIAIRCGRIKRDRAGNLSGETSWLARRLGLLPEGGRSAPTPWIHSDVLALIARRGLGVSPREVEAD
jgi:hypothetical protein